MKKFALLLLAVTLIGCSQSPKLTLKEAQKIALKEVNGEVIKAKEEKDDGQTNYDFTITKDNTKYEIEVDGSSGKIIKKEQEQMSTQSTTSTSQTQISVDDAKNKAIERVGGGTVTKADLDSDDGVSKYEIEVVNDNKEYDIEIDANSGEIIKYEEESNS